MGEKREITKEELLERLERAARALRRQEFALAIVSFAVGVAYLAVMLNWGSVRLREAVSSGGTASEWRTVGWYLFLFTLFYHAVHLPVSFVRGYVVQKRFRLSEQRLRRWAWSHFKKVAVSVGFIIVLGEFLYLFLRMSSRFWWVWAWAGYVVFGLLINRFGSRFLLPLFYERADLDDPSLTERLADLVKRAGFRVADVKRIVIGKDTRKANAAIAGLGSSKEILVSDTLIEALEPAEIEAVVAHELGHARLRHSEVLFAMGIVISLLGFTLAGGVLKMSVDALALTGVHDVAGFPLIVLVMSGLYLAMTPPLNFLSRRMERIADVWAARFTKDAASLISALEKLSATNLAERSRPRYWEILFSSHPSMARRAEALKALDD